MKKTLILLTILGLLPLGTMAQNHRYLPDSAALIVDRYLNLLNSDNLHADTMLYIRSTITYRDNPTDTQYLYRWFVPPQHYHTELWHGDTLVFGAYSNGHDCFRQWKNGRWRAISHTEFIEVNNGYDFRGTLYNWRTQGIELTYEGEWTMLGQAVYRVLVNDPSRRPRNYIFQKDNGLLVLIDEQSTADTVADNTAKTPAGQSSTPGITLRAIHEYIPFDHSKLPSVESYQYDDGSVAILHHRYAYRPIDATKFQYRKP